MKSNIIKKMLAAMTVFLTVFFLIQVSPADEKNVCSLHIGTSLHPYYSWVKNIVGDAADVSTLIPSGVDPHSYQPVASDMKHLEGLDVVVVNGLGHDEFVNPMLKAIDNKDLQIIDTSKRLPLIPTFNKHYSFEENDGKVSYNSHTYIAITGAIQQMQMITRKLGRLCPDRAGEFIRNVRIYSAKLRKMLQSTLMQIDMLNLNTVRIATVHDGYSYLFQELGLEVSAVVQPRHGVKPSARQLQDTIKRIKRAKVNVLFGELDYEKKYVDIIYQETGCRLYALSHISNGAYTAEHFEQTIQKNLDIIVQALSASAESLLPPNMPGNMQKSMSKEISEDMAKKMREQMKQNLQKTVPQMQSEKMSEQMQRKMQDTTRQMRENMQDKMQQIVPEMQSRQMKDAAEQVQNTVKRNLRQVMPETVQQGGEQEE